MNIHLAFMFYIPWPYSLTTKAYLSIETLPAPAGEILFDVVAEALRRGSLSVAPSSSKGEQACPEGGGGGEGSQKDHGGPGGVALDFVLAAEQSGWDTSVTFLEKPGAMRLRLLRSDS